MKNASMPKFSILPLISDEILPWFCSDDLIQILIKLGLVPNVKNQAIFRRICMESLEHNYGNTSPTIDVMHNDVICLGARVELWS